MIAQLGPESAKPSGPVDRMNAMIDGIPPMHRMGLRIVALSEEHVIGAAPLAGNHNHIGTMYAGTQFGVAEVVGGALWLPNFDTDRVYPVVKDLQIRYIRPATSDIRAEASIGTATVQRMKREVVATGKSDFVIDSVLTDVAGVVVATAVGTYQIRSR